MTDLNTSIRRRQLKPIKQDDLDATNTPTDGQVAKVNMPAGDFTYIDIASVTSATYTTSFVNADLSSAGVMVITHNLGVTYPLVFVYDNSEEWILPTFITYVDNNTVHLDFAGLTPLTGTYNVRINGSGGNTGDSISDADNDTKVEVEKNADEDIIRFTSLAVQRAQIDINGLKLSTGADVTEFSIDGTLAGNSDDAVPTEKAVKTYIDGEVTPIVSDVSKNETNIVLNAFRIAVNGSLTQFNMVDGIVDEYEDESGVDNINSTNLSYNSTDDYYSPTGGTDTKLLLNLNGTDGATSTIDESESAHSITFNGTAQLDTAIKKFGTASLLLDGNSDYLSIPDSTDWDIFANTSDSWNIELFVKHTDYTGTEAYMYQFVDGSHYWLIRHSADSTGLNFVAFNGTAISTACKAGSPSITDSNWHHILTVKIANVIAIYLDGVQVAYDTFSNTGTFASPLSVGVGAGDSQDFFDGNIDGIRIYKGNPLNASPNSGKTDTITVPTSEHSSLPNNMTLISETFTAEAQPDTGRIVLFTEDIDSITLNQDLLAKISRDGGTTYSTATLENVGEYESGKNILTASVDISGQPAGTSLKYKIETANHKDIRSHGCGLSWD